MTYTPTNWVDGSTPLNRTNMMRIENELAALDTALTAPDVWHAVGTAGEPVFQDSWGNYGGPYVGARFRKMAGGVVYVQGLVNRPSPPGGGSTVFVLPAGYRPLAFIAFATPCNGGWAQIGIDGSGNVQVTTAAGGATPGTFTYLSGVSFPADL